MKESKTKCIIITNKNSWVSEPIISRLKDSNIIDLHSVVFFDAKFNWKLVKRRFKQYGFRKFGQKLIFIINNSFGIIKNSKYQRFKLSYQTVKESGIRKIVSNNLNSKKVIDYINEVTPNIVLVFSCSQILSKEFLANKSIKVVNFHDSLLPIHKGPSPSFWVLYNQEKITGYTIHEIVPKIDSGKIFYQEEVTVDDIVIEEELIMKVVTAVASKIDFILDEIVNGELLGYKMNSLNESYEVIPTFKQRKELKRIISNE